MTEEGYEGIYPDISVRIQSKEGLVLVKDAYMRQMDVMYQWVNSLNLWQAAAIKSFLSDTALYEATHPLHPGQEGITLYLGYDQSNRPRLLFGLRQVEYIQYYIHTMRLSTPSWVNYYVVRENLLADGSKDALEKLKSLEEPSYDDGKDDWVPLPDMVLPADLFIRIEEITIPSCYHLNKINKRLILDQRIAEKHERAGLELPVFDSRRFDNILAMPIPEVNEVVEKMKEEQRRQQDIKNREANIIRLKREKEAREWEAKNASAPREDQQELVTEEQAMEQVSKQEDEPRVAEKRAEEDAREEVEDEDQETALGNEPKFSLDEDGNVVIEVENDSPSPEDERDDSPEDEEDDFPEDDKDEGRPPEDISARYHFLCQQALLVATEGGALNFNASNGESKNDEQDVGPDPMLPTEAGKSCFVALSVTRWEDNPNVVLEVGWSAVYFQEKGAASAHGDKGKPAYEEMRDSGHMIVQDHWMDKKNGSTQSDDRDAYLFGDSIPVPQNELKKTIKLRLQDIWKKAGRGTIFVVTHSKTAEEHDFSDIGVDASTYKPEFQLDTWKVPPYMTAAGCGSLFLINTAVLFGGIENLEPTRVTSPSPRDFLPGRTEKDLQHVTYHVFSKDSTKQPQNCGNAGNAAFYTLEVFLAIMTGDPLPELRTKFNQDIHSMFFMEGSSTDNEHSGGTEFILSKNSNDDELNNSAVVTAAALDNEEVWLNKGNMIKEEDPIRAAAKKEGYVEVFTDKQPLALDDGFLEDEMIGKVLYEDDDGNLVDMEIAPADVEEEDEMLHSET